MMNSMNFIGNDLESMFQTPDQICQNLPSRICQAPGNQPEEEPADEPYREPEEINIQENREPETIPADKNVQVQQI